MRKTCFARLLVLIAVLSAAFAVGCVASYIVYSSSGFSAEYAFVRNFSVPVYRDATRTETCDDEECAVTLSGLLPKGVYAAAYPVSFTLSGQSTLVALDITLYYPDGRVFQPETPPEVTVVSPVFSAAAKKDLSFSVYHQKDDRATPDAVPVKRTADNAVSFDADGFSVYAVTVPDDRCLHTYRFYDQDRLVDFRILSEGEPLTKPATPPVTGPHSHFIGWYTAPDGGEAFTSFGPEGTLSGSVETDLYARFGPIYHVYFRQSHEDDAVVIFTQTYYADDVLVSADFVPFPVTEQETLIGWTRQKGGNVAENQIRLAGDDLQLYPVLRIAYTVTFRSQGGTYVAPEYIGGGTAVGDKMPDDPTREGFTFAGWFTEAEGGTPFTAATVVNEHTTVYAHWTSQNIDAGYTVVYWKQNADDDGYSYSDSVYVDKEYTYGGWFYTSVYVGTVTDVASSYYYDETTSSYLPLVGQSDRYDYFTYSRFDGNKTVKETGTVVNVYYDRVTYDFIFDLGNYGNIMHMNGSDYVGEEYALTVRYGQSLLSL